MFLGSSLYSVLLCFPMGTFNPGDSFWFEMGTSDLQKNTLCVAFLMPSTYITYVVSCLQRIREVCRKTEGRLQDWTPEFRCLAPNLLCYLEQNPFPSLGSSLPMVKRQPSGILPAPPTSTCVSWQRKIHPSKIRFPARTHNLIVFL